MNLIVYAYNSGLNRSGAGRCIQLKEEYENDGRKKQPRNLE